MRKVWLAALSVTWVACGTGREVAGGPEVVTDTIGNTIVVRTVSGSQWGADATLVPELSIGEMDGPDEYLFGSIASVAVDDDRNVYVFDQQAQNVRIYDPEGGYMRTLGGPGQGPGELQQPEAMAVLPDGRVVVRDPGNTRLQVYGPGEESSEQWPYIPAFYSNYRLWTDNQGRTYVAARDLSRPGVSFGDLLAVFDSDGTPGDTVAPPYAEFEAETVTEERDGARVTYGVPFAPSAIWAVHPSGHFVSGISSDYRIDLELPEGVLRIERAVEPVRVFPREADHERARTERGIGMTFPGWTWDRPSIPDTKPPFTGLYTGRDGRIWVRVSTEAQEVENEDHDPDNPFSTPVEWRSPLRFDVFEANGAYLGAVNPPEDFYANPSPVFEGDYVWAVSGDDLGIQSVVRYRITLESGT
ncbi:6-bladed beta-propeller [Candidatus Palauibacter sp.]|uniref:6-bladed beta-propeller n=1 Tax=Candidatus Palauibacter sp. TaxID=3101350 RepID=UPI003AF2D447